VADIQTIVGEAISDPAFCNQLAAPPEAILRVAGVDAPLGESREAHRWGLLDTPLSSRRYTVGLISGNPGETRFDVSTEVDTLIGDYCNSGFGYLEALWVLASRRRSRP
jgi:hypothetical protein